MDDHILDKKEKILLRTDSNQKILQIAHGKVIPDYSSAYSLRCHTLIKNLDRKLISTAGAIFKDEKFGYSEQYRSILLTGLSFIRGNRSMEIYISRGKYLRKKYLQRMKKLAESSDIIIFEGPWQYPLVKNILTNKLIIYDAHNVEYSLRAGNKYQEDCKNIEGDLLSRSDIVFSVTKKDIEKFIELYEVNKGKIFFAPHEITLSTNEWKGQDSNSIVFIGSVYSPNNIALNHIVKLANQYPQFTFEIIGSAKPKNGSKLRNLVYHGIVDNLRKDEIMSKCFLALNPVTEGSGRNLKMIDYIAHGLPIISTPIGVRGFEDYNIKDSIIVSDIDHFGMNIEKLAKDREKVKEMSKNSRILYEDISKTENTIDPDDIIMQAYHNFKNLQSKTQTNTENKTT